MTTSDQAPREGGFTLVELIVVLGVLTVLVGMATPLASAVIDAGRRSEVEAELEAIGEALADHWYDRASFPVTLTDATFLGVYLQPGVVRQRRQPRARGGITRLDQGVLQEADTGLLGLRHLPAGLGLDANAQWLQPAAEFLQLAGVTGGQDPLAGDHQLLPSDSASA